MPTLFVEITKDALLFFLEMCIPQKVSSLFHLAELCTPMPYEGTSVFGRITEPLAVLQLDHSPSSNESAENVQQICILWISVESCSIFIMFRNCQTSN